MPPAHRRESSRMGMSALDVMQRSALQCSAASSAGNGVQRRSIPDRIPKHLTVN